MAYFVFAREVGPMVRRSMSVPQAGKAMGHMWRALSETQRDAYVAAHLKEATSAFIASPPPMPPPRTKKNKPAAAVSSAFFLFIKDVGKRKKRETCGRRLGEMWRALPTSKREKYMARAAKAAAKKTKAAKKRRVASLV